MSCVNCSPPVRGYHPPSHQLNRYLARAIREHEMKAAACTTDEQLLQHFGQPVPEYNANGALLAYLRREMVFAGDSETHQALKKSSDGFEHGYLSLTDIRVHVENGAASAGLAHIRSGISRVLGLSEDVEQAVRAVAPNYNDDMRATLFGIIDDAAHAPSGPTEFRELSFALELADLAYENSQLRLRLTPQISADFQCGGSLIPDRLRLFRDLLVDPRNEGVGDDSQGG